MEHLTRELNILKHELGYLEDRAFAAAQDVQFLGYLGGRLHALQQSEANLAVALARIEKITNEISDLPPECGSW